MISFSYNDPNTLLVDRSKWTQHVWCTSKWGVVLQHMNPTKVQKQVTGLELLIQNPYTSLETPQPPQLYEQHQVALYKTLSLEDPAPSTSDKSKKANIKQNHSWKIIKKRHETPKSRKTNIKQNHHERWLSKRKQTKVMTREIWDLLEYISVRWSLTLNRNARKLNWVLRFWIKEWYQIYSYSWSMSENLPLIWCLTFSFSSLVTLHIITPVLQLVLVNPHDPTNINQLNKHPIKRKRKK